MFWWQANYYDTAAAGEHISTDRPCHGMPCGRHNILWHKCSQVHVNYSLAGSTNSQCQGNKCWSKISGEKYAKRGSREIPRTEVQSAWPNLAGESQMESRTGKAGEGRNLVAAAAAAAVEGERSGCCLLELLSESPPSFTAFRKCSTSSLYISSMEWRVSNKVKGSF